MKTITGKIFSEMVLNGYRDLKNHYEKVNDLNVFPVPDGDTGTNIAATLTGGVNAMKDANFDSIGDVAEKLAGGMAAALQLCYWTRPCARQVVHAVDSAFLERLHKEVVLHGDDKEHCGLPEFHGNSPF